MPPISLVVCVHRQRDLLERLIHMSQGCYDELLVIHDGPDEVNIREIVTSVGGAFYQRPRAFQQEPHWPFAWEKANHDWILRLDADEFPSPQMKEWLQSFRRSASPAEISGYTCIWPLWNGTRAVSKKWPAERLFLFNKQTVRFFGMCEQTPVPDQKCDALELVLCHQPKRKSYGIYNMLFRNESKRVANIIAVSLHGKPTDLACWRWNNSEWPSHWEQIRRHPVRTAIKKLLKATALGIKDQWKRERRIFFMAALSGPLHVSLICFKFIFCKSTDRNNVS